MSMIGRMMPVYGWVCPPSDGEKLIAMTAQRDELLAALKALRIDANRLCDRNEGGSYEADCRRAIAVADAAITKAVV